MSISLTSPVTGAAMVGLTSPTYTVVSDNAPPGNPGRQYVVTVNGGTQTGVGVHSISSPHSINFTRPAVPKLLGSPNPVTGVIANVPMNEYTIVTRKGVIPLAGQASRNMIIKTTVSVPAGADLADPLNCKAGLSFHIGSLWQVSSGEGDMIINGVL